MQTRLIGVEKEVIIAPDRPTVLIGERINPTGRKRLAEALKRAELGLLEQEARSQASEGADVIDVNVGVTGLDEEAILPQAVRLAAQATGLPISVDTARVEALEAALKVCPGKPLVNSVSGEESSLQRVLPLVKEYGAAVIGLAMDEEGIPGAPERRLGIAEKILAHAVTQGISQRGRDHRPSGPQRGRRPAGCPSHPGEHQVDSQRTGSEYDSGREQRLLWTAP